MNEKVFGPESGEVAHNYDGLAFVYQAEHKQEQQKAALRQVITIVEELPKESLRLSIASQHLGDFYYRQKRYPEAETAYLQSFKAAEQSPPEVMLMSAAQRLGQLYNTWEKPEQAATYYLCSCGRAGEEQSVAALYTRSANTLAVVAKTASPERGSTL